MPCVKCNGDLIWGQFITGENICMDCKSLTPLQINQKIAQLKGNYVQKAGPGKIIGAETTPVYELDKNWAENISDAWKLFEEMPNDTSIAISKNGRLFSIIIGDSCYFEDESKRFIYADTAPLAICAAYIAWRESNA